MKILSQNRQQVINLEQTYKLQIENNGQMPQITASSCTGIKSCLGIYLPKEAENVLNEIMACKEEVYHMPLSERYSAGRTLSERDINAITENFEVSKHCIQRMNERGFFDNSAPQKDVKSSVKESVLKNVLAFWNEDGTASIAVDANHYFVVQFVYTPVKRYVFLTYNDASNNGYNVFEKKRFAQGGR